MRGRYIRYTSNPDAPGHNPDCATRVIRMVEEQVDPLQPPKLEATLAFASGQSPKMND